jgi:hypothetical protein
MMSCVTAYVSTIDAPYESEPVALAWTVILAFTRISTRPGPFTRPLIARPAFDLMDNRLRVPSVTIL